MSLGNFLIERLREYGVNHIFGIPGDYTLNFINQVEDHPDVKYVGVSREDSAGYAADSYARLKGCGVVCVTYSVGAMNVINAIAGAYAERSPVVIITGKPSKEDLMANPNKHHTINNALTQKEIFSKVTCAAITLDSTDIKQNMLMIHTALKCMEDNSRPIYIEFSNKDIVRPITFQQSEQVYEFIAEPLVKINYPDIDQSIMAMQEIMQTSINKILIVGHEVFRLSLEPTIIDFAKQTNIPIFTTILGKSTVDEISEPLSLGCVSQLCSDEKILNAINESDCIITLGMTNTDVDAFTFTPNISINMDVGVSINGKQLVSPIFPKMIERFCDVFKNMLSQDQQLTQKWFKLVNKDCNGEWARTVDDVPNTLTLKYVFDTISKKILNDNHHIIISDIGESLFGMIDIPVSHGQFVSMAYYTSMGVSIPGAVGIQFAAPKKRPIIILGDGSFQMCCAEIGSFVRYNMNPIIIILNNKGYSTERAIMDGKFNDIHNWNYEKITNVMGGGLGMFIDTPAKFLYEIDTALNMDNTLFVLNIEIDQHDMTPTMKMIAQRMCKEKL